VLLGPATGNEIKGEIIMASKSASISQKKEAAPAAEKKSAPAPKAEPKAEPKAAPKPAAPAPAPAAPAPAAPASEPSDVDALKEEVARLNRIIGVLVDGFLRDSSRGQRAAMDKALKS